MSARPTVLVLSFSIIAADARVLKQVRLLASDFDVVTCGHGPQPEGTVEHIEVPVEHQAWVKDPRWLLLRQYRRVYRTNPAVAYARPLLKRRRFDVVLADDIETVPLALDLAPLGGVHADLHEYAPGQRSELRRWRWFVRPYVRWLCRRFVPQAASVTTVGPSIAERFRREFGFSAEVVMNAAPLADHAPGTVTEPIRLVHSGIAQANRHLELMIEAVENAARPVTLDLFLMANDQDYVDRLTTMTAGSARVRVRGPVPYNELVTTLNGYDVGVFLLPPVNENYRWALPNKLFDFVQARLGVIVGPSVEMAKLVREHGLGAVTEGFTAQDLTHVINGLTPQLVRGWRQAADAAARELSAEEQSGPWLEAIRRLAARG
ncbi:glycosyltransferase [Xylanimonas ulmi]|uniref:Glycosyltransferase involved in cell wall biosynthesis n=1 Tax=Xylanimonas ulmi TaxID=228973 RepID=A0A4V2EXL7_9MICO|nr:glycosyltransferase [Xylanibacterium ulmi]RZS59930.1 glycosyltransferase involved in cell wall biosynthesis [Xylanibacterium ulmi]